MQNILFSATICWISIIFTVLFTTKDIMLGFINRQFISRFYVYNFGFAVVGLFPLLLSVYTVAEGMFYFGALMSPAYGIYVYLRS